MLRNQVSFCDKSFKSHYPNLNETIGFILEAIWLGMYEAIRQRIKVMTETPKNIFVLKIIGTVEVK